MKIKSRINFSFVTIFILILSFVCFAVIVYASNLVVENIRSYLYLSSHSKAEHIRTFVQGQKKTAVILAAASVYRDFLEEPKNSSQYPIIKKKIDDRLARTIAADSNIDETLIIGVDGIVVASSDRNKEGVDLSQEDYFILAKDEVFVKDLYFSGTTNRLNYIISAPVKDDQDNFLGVSVLSYSPNKFFSLVKIEDGLGITEENFLVNRNRFFITPSIFWGSDVILKQKSNAKNVVDCFDPDEVAYVEKNGYQGLREKFGSQLVEAKDYRGVDVFATHAYIPETGWCLVSKIDRFDALSFRSNLIITFVIIFIIAGLIFILISRLISEKIISPLRILKLGVDKIKQGDFDSRIIVESKDEIGEISDSFNDMADDLKKTKLALENYNKKLKKQVDEQTKSLEEDKNKLEEVNSDLEQKIRLRTADLEKNKSIQEQLIEQRTEELNQKVEDLEKLNKFMINRENKMIELKNKIKELENKIKS